MNLEQKYGLPKAKEMTATEEFFTIIAGILFWTIVIFA